MLTQVSIMKMGLYIYLWTKIERIEILIWRYDSWVAIGILAKITIGHFLLIVNRYKFVTKTYNLPQIKTISLDHW